MDDWTVQDEVYRESVHDWLDEREMEREDPRDVLSAEEYTEYVRERAARARRRLS